MVPRNNTTVALLQCCTTRYNSSPTAALATRLPPPFPPDYPWRTGPGERPWGSDRRQPERTRRWRWTWRGFLKNRNRKARESTVKSAADAAIYYYPGREYKDRKALILMCKRSLHLRPNWYQVSCHEGDPYTFIYIPGTS